MPALLHNASYSEVDFVAEDNEDEGKEKNQVHQPEDSNAGEAEEEACGEHHMTHRIAVEGIEIEAAFQEQNGGGQDQEETAHILQEEEQQQGEEEGQALT